MLKKILLSAVLLSALLIPSSFGVSEAQGAGSLPVLLGMYPSGELYQSIDEVNALDTYLGEEKVSIAATFVDIESPDWLINAELGAAWNNGYVPFVNLGSERSAQEIAQGDVDASIRNWAALYKFWAGDNDRRAFIAPLQEVNGGYYVPYSGDPANYKKAFLRIVQIFKDEGVPDETISWVFAPNGWSDPNDYPFEAYYPGNSVVDVVGFSSFNFGDCTDWGPESYEEIYEPYLDRMAAMAPGKPIFLAEIGSVAEGPGFDRGAWYQDTLTKIGNYPGVRAILHYDKEEAYSGGQDVNCSSLNYKLDANGGEGKADFKDVVTQAPYGHWWPNSDNMKNIGFGRPEGTFEDVWPASEFSGVSDPYYQEEVQSIFNAGLSAGCRTETFFEDDASVPDFTYRYYCPESGVTRAQMAVFLENGMAYPASYSPGDMSPYTFADSATHWAKDWIEALYQDGVTAGCGGGNFCPQQQVTREQMAVFLLRSIDVTPGTASGTVFNDVPEDASSWAVDWIEELYSRGITAGCGGGNYCPQAVVTRKNMAIFLTRTFNLP